MKMKTIVCIRWKCLKMSLPTCNLYKSFTRNIFNTLKADKCQKLHIISTTISQHQVSRWDIPVEGATGPGDTWGSPCSWTDDGPGRPGQGLDPRQLHLPAHGEDSGWGPWRWDSGQPPGEDAWCGAVQGCVDGYCRGPHQTGRESTGLHRLWVKYPLQDLFISYIGLTSLKNLNWILHIVS